MTRLMLTLSLLLSLEAFAADATGTWKSAAAEDLGNGSFATREFVLTNSKWSLAFTLWADRDLKTPLVVIHFDGTWKQLGESKTVKGANDAIFEFAHKQIELKADVAKNFGFSDCGLTVGQTKDVSKQGCGFVASVAKYPREFDLVSRSGTQLFLGARPADNDLGSEQKRPTALGAPLTKQ